MPSSYEITLHPLLNYKAMLYPYHEGACYKLLARVLPHLARKKQERLHVSAHSHPGWALVKCVRWRLLVQVSGVCSFRCGWQARRNYCEWMIMEAFASTKEWAPFSMLRGQTQSSKSTKSRIQNVFLNLRIHFHVYCRRLSDDSIFCSWPTTC